LDPSSNQLDSVDHDALTRIDGLILAVRTLSTFLVYLPTLTFDFVDFDDLVYIVNNASLRDGFSPSAAAGLFSTAFEVNWIPITQLSHMLDVEFYGLEPAGHHATSVLLHALNAALLFACLRKLTGARWRSAFVAALFAFHPLRVESVAWVSERKDVLSTLFAFLCILSYIAYAKRQRVGQYLLSIALLAIGLMAKPMLVTLPFVLLLLDAWPLGRFPAIRPGESTHQRFPSVSPKRLVLEKLPMLAIVAAISAWALFLQASARPDFESLSLGARLGNAVLSYITYPMATIWPADLAILYTHPYRPGTGGTPPSPLILVAAILTLAAACTLALKTLQTRPYRALGLFWYLGTLLPVIGIIQVGAQGHADRYTYFPMIGLVIWIVWEAADFRKRLEPVSKAARTAAIVLLLLGLVAMIVTTRRQLETWRNNRALFEHAVEVSPGHAYLHSILAQQLEKDGEIGSAEMHYRRAIEADPNWTDLRVKLANLLQHRGRNREARVEIGNAIAHSPGRPELYMNLANLQIAEQQWDAALGNLHQAAALAPSSSAIQNNLANVLLRVGDLAEASAAFQRTVELDPGLTSAWYNWAMVVGRMGDYPAAREKLERVLDLDPSHAGARERLAKMR